MSKAQQFHATLNSLLKRIIILRFFIQTGGGPLTLLGEDLSLYAEEIRKLKRMGCLACRRKPLPLYSVTENGYTHLHDLQARWEQYQCELENLLGHLSKRERTRASQIPNRQTILKSRFAAQLMVLTYIEQEASYSEAIHRCLCCSSAIVAPFQVSNCVSRLLQERTVEFCEPPKNACVLTQHQLDQAKFFRITPLGRDKLARLRAQWSELKENLPEDGPLSLPPLRLWFLEK